MDRELWVKSGHIETFGENMYMTQTPDERVFAIKPMNCPGHIQVFKQGLRSYRELPLRFAEFGEVHRYEPSGALHGLMRVRAFTQDDAHIFCTPDQITAESVEVTELILSIYRDFGFDDVRIKFSDRPAKRVGSDEIWDKAESALRHACEAAGIETTLEPRGRGLLRSEAGVRAARCHRARLAMRHPAGGLQSAAAPRCGLCRRGQPEAHPGHAASGDVRVLGAIYRHFDRTSRR